MQLSRDDTANAGFLRGKATERGGVRLSVIVSAAEEGLKCPLAVVRNPSRRLVC